MNIISLIGYAACLFATEICDYLQSIGFDLLLYRRVPVWRLSQCNMLNAHNVMFQCKFIRLKYLRTYINVYTIDKSCIETIRFKLENSFYHFINWKGFNEFHFTKKCPYLVNKFEVTFHFPHFLLLNLLIFNFTISAYIFSSNTKLVQKLIGTLPKQHTTGNMHNKE